MEAIKSILVIILIAIILYLGFQLIPVKDAPTQQNAFSQLAHTLAEQLEEQETSK